MKVETDENLIENYVKEIHASLEKNSKKKDFKNSSILSLLSDEKGKTYLLELGKSIFRIHENSPDNAEAMPAVASSQEKTFVGNIASITIENFMSVQGKNSLLLFSTFPPFHRSSTISFP